uniref:Uncharacterized protein n=1 Tax=Aegilops tauschii subsp. strangulata TaxID=200361 RepID=A0A453E8G3_AEGTS
NSYSTWTYSGCSRANRAIAALSGSDDNRRSLLRRHLLHPDTLRHEPLRHRPGLDLREVELQHGRRRRSPSSSSMDVGKDVKQRLRTGVRHA